MFWLYYCDWIYSPLSELCCFLHAQVCLGVPQEIVNIFLARYRFYLRLITQRIPLWIFREEDLLNHMFLMDFSGLDGNFPSNFRSSQVSSRPCDPPLIWIAFRNLEMIGLILTLITLRSLSFLL